MNDATQIKFMDIVPEVASPNKLFNPGESIAVEASGRIAALLKTTHPQDSREFDIPIYGITKSAYEIQVTISAMQAYNAYLIDKVEGKRLLLAEGLNVVRFDPNPKEIEESQTDRFKILIDPEQEINEEMQTSFSIYPNPVSTGACKIILPDHLTTATVQIQNYAGQILKRSEYDVTEHHTVMELDLSNFATGVYIVTISTENTRLVKKLVVE
jgi:hypothetical protein